ncbi:hypothetical protein B0T16DRAFT_456507 [Cercophora newfieldiana]|uniref:Uncharacterized protein n=1 Tax=Cercophora newfieldiana TaxID=92897 RepID=A0AA39YCL7_9PEZI|nr:hypothetical protein B0T16DRAFT_456507 [Cercophora newfieldiana]
MESTTAPAAAAATAPLDTRPAGPSNASLAALATTSRAVGPSPAESPIPVPGRKRRAGSPAPAEGERQFRLPLLPKRRLSAPGPLADGLEDPPPPRHKP